MGGASGYITRRLPLHLRFLWRKQPSVQFTARPGTVLVPISQGTEVTKVTEYVPFRYFTHTVSIGTSSITPCYDVEGLETKAHVGLDSGQSIEYIKHRVNLEPPEPPVNLPKVIPGIHTAMDRPSKEGLEQYWSRTSQDQPATSQIWIINNIIN